MQSYLLMKHISFREVQDRVVKLLLGRIIGVLKDSIIIGVCITPANHNCPGQMDANHVLVRLSF